MKIRRVSLGRLNTAPYASEAAVVIDVLRSFSTAAYALAGGAATVHPVATIAEALHLRQRFADALLVGAFGGGAAIPGFDCGNSPSELIATQRLAGRRVVQHTAAGVHGLIRCAGTPLLFAGSLVCARATARALLNESPADLLLVTTGEWVDRDGDEDIACADYLEALLRGDDVDAAIFEQRVRDSDFGQRFVDGSTPHLPAQDLAACALADRFDFALRAENADGLLRLRCDPGAAG
jgi:2-phosphosulfolactate phosphatase